MKKAMLITIFVLSILIGMICVTNAENNQPEFLQNLFHEYFPDCSYEDGYLQYDETVIFIGRKPDGTLVLLCGAYEGEDGWEWVESTPLPEGTRIGDENITDAVNMNAWRGGAAVGVRKMGKGLWGINYVNSYDFFVGPDWVGMLGAETDVQFFGTHAWGDITTIDWSTLPPEEYIDRETKEATAIAFNFLRANSNRISQSISTTTKDYLIHYQDLQGIGMTSKLAMPTLIALCSIALSKPTVGSLAILGDISISGTVIKVDNLANALQVCLDSGAKKILLPITSAADLSTVPAELIGCFNLIFYNSAEDAVFKALGVE